MIRCSNCHNEINLNFPDVTYNHWLKLSHYILHELTEGEITEVTYEDLMDALMAVKPWAEESDATK